MRYHELFVDSREKLIGVAVDETLSFESKPTSSLSSLHAIDITEAHGAAHVFFRIDHIRLENYALTLLHGHTAAVYIMQPRARLVLARAASSSDNFSGSCGGSKK
jgi:hypothetical protein